MRRVGRVSYAPKWAAKSVGCDASATPNPQRYQWLESTFIRAKSGTGSTFDEAMYVPSGGLAISGGTRRATRRGVVVTGPTAAAKRAVAVIRQLR
jgi:hypothetical protein